MRKKYLIVFFTTIICLFLFNITSYAGTDYSVYDEETGKYYIKFSDSMKESLDLPTADLPCSFSSANIYYFILKNNDGSYYCFYSTTNFVEIASHSSSFDGNYNFKTSNYTRFNYCYAASVSSEWEDKGLYDYGYYKTSDLSSILVSSDDICNNSNSEVVVPKTTYTEPEVDRGENFLLSSSYNTAWIESYIDLNQDPVDRN